MRPIPVPRLLLSAACIAAFVFTAAAAVAQQVREDDTLTAVAPASSRTAPIPVVPARPAGDAEDDVTVLSPFVVSASARDTGYYVENTLAGTRLNTNLSDLASSITVVTRQQMEDTAANDMNDIFLYEANTEGTGNYTSFSLSGATVVTDNTSMRPETANRVRGLGSVDRSRNFYPSISRLPFDSYNTESVEINRGPNSLLFGLGSPAGIVNQSTAIANTTRSYAQVKGQYGAENDYRAQLRANIPLIRHRLGLFVGGVYADRGFSRQPASDITRRGYVALTASVSPSTTIRANYESWHNSYSRPNYITPFDMVTPWVKAGMPNYDPSTLTVYYGTGAAGVPSPGATPQNTVGMHTDSANFPAFYYDRGTPVIWMQRWLSYNGLRDVVGAGGLPMLAMSADPLTKDPNRSPLFSSRSVTDKSIYDWENTNLFSINSGKAKADIYNIEIDQKILDNLYLQLGWYREDFDARDSMYVRGAVLAVDVNRKHINGEDNPFFGRPYFSINAPMNNYTPVQNETLRASLAYSLDFRKDKGWRKWLGLHRFMGLWSRQDLDQQNAIYGSIVTSSHAWTNDQNKMTAVGSQYTIVQRYYVGDFLDNRIAYAPGSALPPGQAYTFPLTWGIKDATTGAVTWTTENTTVSPELHQSSARTRQTVESISAAWQAYLLDDRIVATLGLRNDTSRSRNTKPLGQTPPTATGVFSINQLNSFGPTEEVSGNTTTAGIVVKPFSWLSFYYNRSDNFTPASTRNDIYGNPLPLPTGEGQDFGVRFAFFNSRLIASVNWFEASSDKARGTAADTYVGRAARMDEQFFFYWANQVARARLPGASESAIAAEILNIMRLPNDRMPREQTLASTSTVDAKGLEIQLIYNPVRNWNTKLTVARQEAYYTNIAPEWDAWVDARLDVWKGANDATTGTAFWSQTLTQLGSSGNSTIGGWFDNTIASVKLTKANEGKQTQNQREWRANLLSTYRFTSGPLRNVTIGGAARWQSKSIIGYLGAAPESDGVIRELDANKPVYDDAILQCDFWVAYSFKMPWLSKKLRAAVQLNVRDAFENGGILPLKVNPDGAPTIYRIVDSRQWFLSLTLDF